MTHSCVIHDSYTYVTWLIPVSDMLMSHTLMNVT